MNFFTIQQITVIIILAIFFIGRHATSYLMGKRPKTKTPLPTVIGRFLVSYIVLLLIPLVLILDISNFNIGSQITEKVLLIYVLGTMVSVIGIIFMALARYHRQKDWGFLGDDAGQTLFTKGIYSVTRHPYYVGSNLIGLGIYLILNSWFIIITIPAVIFTWRVIKGEDVFLKNKFGKEWEEYKNTVGVIPFVK